MKDTTLQRYEKVLYEYRNGKKLEEIAKNLGVSRQRVHQMLKSAILGQIEKIRESGKSVNIDEFTKSVKKYHNTNRPKIIYGDLQKKHTQLVERASAFHSLSRFLRQEKIGKGSLEKYFPEVAEIIKKNSERNKLKWSRYYIKCRKCGTTTIPHQSVGYCQKCYLKSNHFKEIALASYLRNIEKRKARNKAYAKKYEKRPEVRAKHRRLLDIQKFDGNREKTIQRDGFKCTNCGIDREKSEKIFKKDLYVRHIDNDANNNDLSNLKTMCLHCFQKENKNNLRR